MAGVRFTAEDLRKNPRYVHLVAGVAGAKPSKYHNVITHTLDGKFDSQREAARFNELKILEKAGKITALQRQVTFKLLLNAADGGVQHIESFRADFVYFLIAERKWITEDCKGVRTRDYLRKKRLLRELYGIEIAES